MKNKKGFTLIELLAVIIILGLLMLIAIPSVTNYINNSRKNSYIDTAKQFIRGATNIVNSGELDVYDTNTTYYIPSSCIPLESGGESPYGGEFDPAYVAVTYDNDSYNYYWISRDNQGIGVKKPTLSDDLVIEDIDSGVSKDDIKANIGILNRNKIVEFNSDCTDISKTSKAERKLNSEEELIEIEASKPNDYMMAGNSGDGNTVYMGTSILKKDIETVTFTDSLQGHVVNGTDCWDISVGQTGATLLWATDSDGNGLYEVTIGAEDGVIASSCARMFINMKNLKAINGFEYLDTSKVTDMGYMFQECDSITSLDLRTFDTSNVTNMTQMFYDMDNLTYLNISSFDTSKVKSMAYMFRFVKKIKTIDISSFSKQSLNQISYIFANCSQLETIYVNSSFDFSSAAFCEYAFWDDRNLVGGAGTVFIRENKDSSYGHIDGGTSNPGYFTLR